MSGARRQNRWLAFALGCGLFATGASCSAMGLRFEKIKSKWGDYALHVSPAELDLAGQRDDSRVGARLQLRLLDTELSKATVGVDRWTDTHGLRARLAGETSRLLPHTARAEVDVFRRWEGKWVPANLPWVDQPVHTQLEVSTGLSRDWVNHSYAWQITTSQTLKTPVMQWQNPDVNRPLYGLVEFTQGLQRPLGAQSGAKTWAHYTLLVAVEHDWLFQMAGKTRTLSMQLGPEWTGNTDQPIKVAARFRLRLHF